ncbi:MAG: hypothetical protein JNK95_11115 [Candidatus Competibacter sp.]|nr:hypothetical protein [Candidatus Competibacter sp.]MDG4605969.1 hypothetical protein [Candidatus Contendobacter sp.]HRD50265.1 hypothetical protein [Candidatus Contendobacter sp.]
MKTFGLLAIGFAVVISTGCAGKGDTDDAASRNEPVGPNMTSELNLGHSSDSILSKYGKPLYKKGRTDSDGKKLEDWFYPGAILSFKDGNLNAFKPR